MNRKQAIKTLSDFINIHSDFGEQKESLHECLSYLENIAIRKGVEK